MKKYLGALLALIMIAALPVSAAGGKGKITLTAEKKELARGEEFTAEIRCNKNPGVQNMRFFLEYDADALEVIDASDKALFQNGQVSVKENGAVSFSWKTSSGSKNSTATGTLATVFFRVRETAPFGESKIGVRYSESDLDIRSADGHAVGFDMAPLTLSIPCPHDSVGETVSIPATLSQAGEGVRTCFDCGQTWPITVLPTVVSADQNTVATVQPGTFQENSAPTVETVFYNGGQERDNAKDVFGSLFIRAFRIRFTALSLPCEPAGGAKMRLNIGKALPKTYSLYTLTPDGPTRVTSEYLDGWLTFDYAPATFVLADTPEDPNELPEELAADEPGENGVPTTTAAPTPEELERKRTVQAILFSLALTALFGAGIVVLLKMRPGKTKKEKHK